MPTKSASTRKTRARKITSKSKDKDTNVSTNDGDDLVAVEMDADDSINVDMSAMMAHDDEHRKDNNNDDDDDENNGVPVPLPATTTTNTTNATNNHHHNSIRNNNDPNTCRILLSTDNHLGYAERDSIRGMDSFAAFEEVLHLGQLYNVDFVLLAGDVFHDNRPSRRTIYTTMEILRRYCMGPNPIRVQIISDPNHLSKSILRSSSSSSSSGGVNYLDPNYSVHLPIFAIHGNHDDPSRDQGGGELLAALDLLAVTNLVNYFGRQEEVDHIQISPILFQKGTTRIALYGLGSLRDERLNRMWEKQKVEFLRPAEEEEEEEEDDENNDTNNKGFFNIFALHQNRDLGRGTKNCVQESMIPEWMDVVVWGHEHECLIEFFESVVGTFRITQPGSSVATSLVPGEAVQKKIGILDINGKKFRLHPVPLTQVRTFVMTEISLREHRSNLDPRDPKIDDKLDKLLQEEVQLMVMRARDKTKEHLVEARTAGNNTADASTTTIKHKIHRPDEVLVRLRVDHVGFEAINNQRFGAKFVGQVANPTDILLFHRKKDPKMASVTKKQGLKAIAPEELERTNMEDLVREHLVSTSEGKLDVYGEQDLSEALEEFVDKTGMVATIADIAADKLGVTQKQLIKGKQGNEPLLDDTQVLEVLERENPSKKPPVVSKSRSQTGQKHSSTVPTNDESMLDDDNDNLRDDSEVMQSSVRKRKATQLHSQQLDDESPDEVMVQRAASRPFQQAAGNRPKRFAPKSKVVYAREDSDDDNEYALDPIIDSGDDDVEADGDDDDEEEAGNGRRPVGRKVTAQRGRKAAAGKTTKKAPADTAKKGTGKRSRPTGFDHSDDEIENDRNTANPDDIDTDWGTAKTRTQRSQW